jgi:hypothetical protein
MLSFSLPFLLSGLLAQAAAAPAPAPLKLDAIAVNLSNVGRPGPTWVHITIERWSTDEERDKLRDALIEKGPDALMDAVRAVKPRVGFISTGTSLGWDIRYAREHVLPTGARRVVIATDRPMRIWEVANGARSADYDFTLAEIHLETDGKGEGKLVPMAKIRYDKDQRAILIENYATEPVRLGEVKVVK